MNDKFEVTFLGTNGSCAYNSGKRVKYGTNTLCVAVRAGSETIIFDSGTGICGFSELKGYQRKHCNLFFSHYHIDHFSGFLFFPEFFQEEKSFDIYGAGYGQKNFEDIVRDFIAPPIHPIRLDSFKAGVRCHTIASGQTVMLGQGAAAVTVKTYGLSHPGHVLGYRVEYGGKAVCYCTDIELADHRQDAGLAEFTREADLLIMDSFFDDGSVIPGWGHSSWREAALWAEAVQAKRLALFHYHFRFDDDEIDAMERKAREIFPETFAAADHMRVEVSN